MIAELDWIPSAHLEPVTRLRKDVLDAARVLSEAEARYLVDAYYAMQDKRKAADQQTNALADSGEPNQVLAWLADQDRLLEHQIQRALARYSASQPLGQWARSQVGIGPVIAAGLLAHIDFSRIHTAGAIWRYAGLDPTVSWGKGEKRPWNASLKVLCWKIGDSFVKTSNHPKSYYGPIYRARKELEEQRNAEGLFAEQAATTLAAKKIKDAATRAVYEAGRLPAGRLDLRARRVAVKLFLSHYFEVGYELHHGTKPPAPYVFAIAKHAHYLPPPNW